MISQKKLYFAQLQLVLTDGISSKSFNDVLEFEKYQLHIEAEEAAIVLKTFGGFRPDPHLRLFLLQF